MGHAVRRAGACRWTQRLEHWRSLLRRWHRSRVSAQVPSDRHAALEKCGVFRLRMYTEIQAPMKHIEEIAHTADWAIRVRAPDVAQVFEAAAEGMFGLLTDLSPIVPEQHHDIRLHAIDVETLLVDWLNELLYLAGQHGLAFTRFTIRG